MICFELKTIRNIYVIYPTILEYKLRPGLLLNITQDLVLSGGTLIANGKARNVAFLCVLPIFCITDVTM